MQNSEKTDNKSVHYGLYITTAAVAGLVCCTAAPLKASAKTPDLWDESRILENWGLDPDSFSQEEGSGSYDSGEAENEDAELTAGEETGLSRIPEELQSYFKEAASAAVDSYAGYHPPSFEREKYSPRADAVRRAVSLKAREESSRYRDALINELISAIRTTLISRRASNNNTGSSGDLPVSSDSVREDGSETEPIREKLLIWPVQEYYLRTHGSGEDPEKSGEEGLKEDDEASKGSDQVSDQELNEEENNGGWNQDQERKSEEELQADEDQESSLKRPLIPLRDPYGALNSQIYRSSDSSFEDGNDEKEQHRTIFVGDSRTVGMYMYAPYNKNEYWSAKDSKGYNWMVKSGIPGMEDLIRENTDIVILMGVNDLGNVTKYTDYINKKAQEWKEKGARTFFVSVNPVVDSKSPNAKNSHIESFNTYVRENLEGVHYIDVYNRIRSSFGSPDGIHFDGPTYREIYRIIHFYLYKGWYEEAGLQFYFDCGKPRTGWNYLDGKWQYMDGSGVRWITDSRVGDVCFEPYPETGLLTPCRAVSLEY